MQGTAGLQGWDEPCNAMAEDAGMGLCHDMSGAQEGGLG